MLDALGTGAAGLDGLTALVVSALRMNDRVELAAVIFDFDGVLVDTERLHFAAFQHVLRSYGMGVDWDEYSERYMCFGDEDVFRLAYRTAEQALSEDEMASLIEQKAEAFQSEVTGSDISVFDGVVTLLSALREASVPCAVCSAAARRDIDLILGSLQLAEWFDEIVSADDVERGKPDPACYRLAVQRLAERFPRRGISPVSAMAIEDTPGGVEAARRAGLWVLAVGTTHRLDELTAAHHFVQRLDRLSFPELQRRFGSDGR